MFAIIQLLFILLLVMVLFMLYKNELSAANKRASHARVEEYWNGKERRQHIRFKRTLDVEYAVEKKLHLKRSGKSVDISEGGMKLLIHEKLAKGTILDLKINMRDSKDFIEVEGEVEAEGEVAWSDDAKDAETHGKRLFYTGIRFLTIKEPAGRHLSDYIRSIASSAEEA